MSIVDGSSVVQEMVLPGRNVFDLTLVNCHSSSYPLPLTHRNIWTEEIRLVGPMLKLKPRAAVEPASERGCCNQYQWKGDEATSRSPGVCGTEWQTCQKAKPEEEVMGQSYQNKASHLGCF